ncbi:acyl-CoA thioesterase [Lacticaseibacillus suihuaensis]
MKMSETKAVTTHRVFPAQLNEHETLYGGQLLYWLDEAASVAAHRLARRGMATGALDNLQFLAPGHLGQAIEFHSVVTGVGRRSMEVFTKVIEEDLDAGSRTLIATAFSTFVANPGPDLTSVEADEPELVALAAGYAARTAANRARRHALDGVDLSLTE